MALVDDKRSGGFTFTWSIHNFSYCVQKESECLDSPSSFVAQLLGGTTWYLQLYPRGDVAPGFISYYLRQDRNSLVINYVLSVRVSNGLFKEIGEQMFDTSSSPYHGYRKFLSLDEVKGPDTYLENDTLTLRCRMWLYNEVPASVVKHLSQASMHCYAHTKIKVSKLKYMWNLNELIDSDYNYKFNQTTKVQSMSTEIPCFTIRLLHDGTFADDTIYFAMELAVEHNNLILTCMIHLLDCDGSIAHSLQGHYLFEKSNKTQIWTLPFLSKRKLLSKESVYLPSGRLTLRCELSVFTGTVSNEMEIFEYGTIEDLQLKTATPTQVPDSTWKENMQRFYMVGKFSDLTVCTPNRQFPVHKAILCAQSEVFSAMFENDMEETHTGIVQIEDLEDDTVSKMLLFLYTDTLDDIDCSMAHKLYYAADKYRIMALHRKCSTYLIHSLDSSNVCNVLVLADVHQDQELKSISQDFISLHSYEIMDSEDWKKLMEANSRLTSETMKLMICKNFMGHLKS